MNYRIAIILLPILALLSCAKDNITISPNVVNVNCDEHTIIFHTNQSFTYIYVYGGHTTLTLKILQTMLMKIGTK